MLVTTGGERRPTGGTGGAEGASGWLQLRGAMDLGTGAVMGDFTGELCTP